MYNTQNKTLTAKSSSRIYLYDNIKFIAILLVVIGHAIDFLARADGNHLEKSLFLTIYSVHMPLFIFISGLFLKPMDKQTPFPAQKVISYVLIGMAIRVFNSVLRLLLGMKPEFSVLDMYDSYSWFMWAIAVFTVLMWVFRSCNTKVILAITLVIGIMAGYDKFLGDKLALMRICVFLPFFTAGYMLSPDALARVFSKKSLKILSLPAIAAILICFFFYGNFYKYLRPMFTGRNGYTSLGDFYSFGFLFRISAYIISAVFGFSIMCLVPNRNFGTVTVLGAKTLQIYFWHRLFLRVLEYFGIYEKISALTGDTFATLIYILIAVLIAFICALPPFDFPTKQLLRLGRDKSSQ